MAGEGHLQSKFEILTKKLKGESGGAYRLAMVVAFLCRNLDFPLALVPGQRLGIDPSADHPTDRSDLLPQIWLATGPGRNLAPHAVVRPFLLGMAAGS